MRRSRAHIAAGLCWCRAIRTVARAYLRALELLQSAPVEVLEQEGESRTAWLAEALGYAIAPREVGLDSYLAALPRLPLTVADPARRRVRRRAAAPLSSPAPDAGVQPPASSHFAVVDATGMAVSVTQSLGGPFGERASRLGFFLARAPEGASMGSDPVFWSVPTVLTRQGVIGLVLGSSGGPRALSAVVQTVTNWVDGGHPVEARGRHASLAYRGGRGTSPAHGSGRRNLG